MPRVERQAGEAAQELALAVAVDAGEADDLAAAHVERDRVEARAAEAGDPQQRLAERGRVRLVGEAGLEPAADDEVDDVVLGDLGRRVRALRGAVAQHRDGVRDLLDLADAMGDVDDGAAALEPLRGSR